jgi:hypothetical protein
MSHHKTEHRFEYVDCSHLNIQEMVDLLENIRTNQIQDLLAIYNQVKTTYVNVSSGGIQDNGKVVFQVTRYPLNMSNEDYHNWRIAAEKVLEELETRLEHV